MKKLDFFAFSENERLNRVLEGEAYYASVHTPNTSGVKLFNALPVFQVNLALDETNEKLAKSYGLKVRPADDNIPKPYVKISRKVKPDADVNKIKPKVVDAMQRPIPAAILIGNGSKVKVKFGTYYYEQQGGGVGTTLFTVQVINLVRYEGKNGDNGLVMDSSGFTVEDFIEDAPASKVTKSGLPDDEIPWESATPQPTDQVTSSPKKKSDPIFDD